ncbi:MAG: site-2 protease family protein [Methanohalobium sp.]|uniref:site-2 protease family protein n=1 Tax=Methanohalobium sp. TaxID=2837493 RepID=UPI0039797EAF
MKPDPDKQKQLSDDTVNELYKYIYPVFNVYEIRSGHDKNLYFYGTPKFDLKTIYKSLWKLFANKGYQLHIKSELGEHIIAASPYVEKKEKVHINLGLAVATFFTTMFAGATMFGVDFVDNPLQIIKGLPFTIAIMTVLGSHEMGHYMAARWHGMRTSLPYFIPFPTIIGTMGAVIKHRGIIPDRKSLFDVGVSGPLIGLIVSIIVTIIGLTLNPVSQNTQQSFMLELGLPPLFLFLMELTGTVGYTIHPVAFAGWVGMFITLLNLLPAGQLDGGHVLRAMVGDKSRYISSFMPFLLLGIGLYVNYFLNENGSIWLVWGLILSFFTMAGHPEPMEDSIDLDKRRLTIGVITFILGLLCFTMVPFTIVQ